MLIEYDRKILKHLDISVHGAIALGKNHGWFIESHPQENNDEEVNFQTRKERKRCLCSEDEDAF